MAEDYILEIGNLTKNFGGVQALDEFEMRVKEKEIHGLIGPNGAGKSTLFNLISGFTFPDKGTILLKDEDITTLSPEKRVELGLARTFQKSNIVSDMSLLDNIKAGIYASSSSDLIKSFFSKHFSLFKRENEMEEKAREALELVGLSGYEERWSDQLVWVERQLLQLARAIVSGPDLLLLDEPAAGMGKKEREKIKKVIADIRKTGITVVVISHNLEMVMEICDQLSVINFGELLFTGSPVEVKQNREVMEAYTGEL